MNLLQAIPDIVYMLDAEGRFVYINDAIRNLGYEPSELIGKHFSQIIHPDDLPRVSREEVLGRLQGVATGDENAPKLFDERRSGQRMTRNLELRLRRGEFGRRLPSRLGHLLRRGELRGLRFAGVRGAGQGTVGIIRDMTVRKEHELALEVALASKEILLKGDPPSREEQPPGRLEPAELQETTILDEEARKVFLECQTQIQTMSMVHEVLYRSSSFAGVEMNSYFERLVDYLANVYEAGSRGIACGIDVRGHHARPR